jgi:hypothetical protein
MRSMTALFMQHGRFPLDARSQNAISQTQKHMLRTSAGGLKGNYRVGKCHGADRTGRPAMSDDGARQPTIDELANQIAALSQGTSVRDTASALTGVLAHIIAHGPKDPCSDACVVTRELLRIVIELSDAKEAASRDPLT